MTTNERLDEIQSRLNNIEARFNNMDTRFNNLDSHLNNIENRLTNSQLNNPDALTQLRPQLDKIGDELKRAEIRDIKIAWYAFMIVGVGLVGAGFAGAGYYWPAFSVGVVVVIIGCCGILFRWFNPPTGDR